MSKHFKRALLLILLASGLALTFSYRDHLDPAFIATRVTAAGPSAPLLFIGLYTVATVLFLPGSVLTLAGGALFGPVWGTLYSLCGATLGAVSAFLITRYVASNEVQARLDASANGQVGRLIKGIEAEGWRFVAFTRLVPLFPFNFLNYALGIPDDFGSSGRRLGRQTRRAPRVCESTSHPRRRGSPRLRGSAVEHAAWTGRRQ
jgi:uncharacterized membrane protein YdjX (TVP38/TMEM64 family)